LESRAKAVGRHKAAGHAEPVVWLQIRWSMAVWMVLRTGRDALHKCDGQAVRYLLRMPTPTAKFLQASAAALRVVPMDIQSTHTAAVWRSCDLNVRAHRIIPDYPFVLTAPVLLFSQIAGVVIHIIPDGTGEWINWFFFCIDLFFDSNKRFVRFLALTLFSNWFHVLSGVVECARSLYCCAASYCPSYSYFGVSQ
jgi:hypothetical protein